MNETKYWETVQTDSEIYTFEYLLQAGVCRLCWNKSEDKDMLLKTNKDILLFNEKTKTVLDIDLTETNLNTVCGKCCIEIETFYSFKQFCSKTDKRLHEILQEGPVKPENIVHEDDITALTDDDAYYEILKLEPFSNISDNDNSENHVSSEKEKKAIIKKKYKPRSATYCHICCSEFKSKESLSVHNSECHGIEENGMFKCFGCEKRFKSRKNRIGHEVHYCKDLKDGYKCTVCNRFLPRRRMYEYHMKEHRHNVSIELPEDLFRCEKCSESFNTKEALKLHMVVHNKDKQKSICDICGRVFTRKDYLRKHMLVHAGIKSYKCPHCDFKATQRSSLTVHIRKHTGERPYHCELCPQRCISSSNLRAHTRRHLGFKKYECTICHKKFGYKISLQEHVSTTHERSETHICDHCGVTYNRHRSLKRHLAVKHSKKIGQEPARENPEIYVERTEDCSRKDDQYQLSNETVLITY